MTGPNADNVLECVEWVKARHHVWEQRQFGVPGPWTDHPIVATKKFTNVYRVLDPGSQFVLTDLACDSETEFLARLLFYRNTNLPGPWAAYGGEISLLQEPELFRRHLHEYRDIGGQVFSGAYMVWGGTEKGINKIDHVSKVVQDMVKNGSILEFTMAETQAERFDILRQNRGVGNFIAMQVMTDFGYVFGPDRENDFIIPGPGSEKGAAWLWPGKSAEYVVRWLQETLWADPECPVLFGRKPSLMDVQNVTCETSKLARYLQKPVGAPYVPAHPGPQPAINLPKWWVGLQH